MITSYTDLEVYKRANALWLDLHQQTLELPEFEQPEIASELRKLSGMVAAFIAAGFSRRFYEEDFRRYIRKAIGACEQLRHYLNGAYKLKYISQNQHSAFSDGYLIVAKQLTKLRQNWNLPNSSDNNTKDEAAKKRAK